MTLYAEVFNGVATRKSLPASAPRRDTYQRVYDLINQPASLQKLCGWYAYEPVPAPPVAASDIAIHVGPVYDAGTDTATDTWTVRAKTSTELAAAVASANRSTLLAQAETALTDNTTFLGITSPTNAQTLAQVRALTRQNNKIIRLLINKLDDTN